MDFFNLFTVLIGMHQLEPFPPEGKEVVVDGVRVFVLPRGKCHLELQIKQTSTKVVPTGSAQWN